VVRGTSLKGVLAAAVLSVAASCAVAAPAWAGEVTSNGDDQNVDGTLRHEIFNAVDGEVITFQGSVDPLVTPGAILIDDSLTLRGNGMDVNTITGIHAISGDRIFDIAPAHTVTIEDLTITGGDAPDGTTPGGFSRDGGNGENGGAILFGAGLLNLESVRFIDNNAGDGSDGSDGVSPGPGFDGTDGGDGGLGGHGGAIYVSGIGSLNVTNSIFEDNSAGDGGLGADGGDGSGGGDGGSGGAGGSGGFGGAIKDSSSGTVTVVNSSFTNNNRAGLGGAGDGGGDGSPDGPPGSGGSGGRGGAIEGSVFSVLNSTFSGNTAGNGGKGGKSATGGGTGGNGGIGGFGGGISAGQGLTATNSTFKSNASGAGGESGELGIGLGGNGGIGGGIQAFGPNTVLTNLTIDSNTAGVAGGGAPGGSPGTGAGVRGLSGVTLNNWLVSNNVNLEGSQMTANCAGTFTFGVFGISFPANTGCPGSVGDPLLGPLQDNGGPTPTMALGVGSPAIDRIPPAGFGCPATDQRGIPRPQGPACDLGAFEVFQPSAAVNLPSNAFTFELRGRTLILNVSSSGTGEVTDAGAQAAGDKAIAAAKRRLKTSSTTGGPGVIEVRLKLTKRAKQKLRQKGKVRVNARITFTPNGGTANSQTAKLKIRRKKTRA
jgi:hypothetical protein